MSLSGTHCRPNLLDSFLLVLQSACIVCCLSAHQFIVASCMYMLMLLALSIIKYTRTVLQDYITVVLIWFQEGSRHLTAPVRSLIQSLIQVCYCNDTALL